MSILATLGGKLLAGGLLFAIATAAYLGWESRVRRAALIEAQSDQLVRAVKERDDAIFERNAIASRFAALPEVRLRLCAQRGPADGCCRPAPAECKP